MGIFLVMAPILRGQAGEPQDPFNKRLLEEGKILYDQGNFAAVVQNMEIASFGFLDAPDRLLECYIYLELAYHGLKNEEKARIFDDKIRSLNVSERLESLKLSESVLSKFNNLRTAFDRIAGRTVRQPPAPSTAPLRSKTEAAPTVETKPAPPPKIRNDVTPPAQEPAVSADNLALARQQTNNDTRIFFYKKAIQDDPNNFDIYFELDDTYHKAKRYREGASLMELLLKYYPENIAAGGRLAEDWLADKSYGKAVLALTAALQINPDHIGLRYLLGEAYLGQKKYAEALAAFDVVMSRDPAYKDAAVLRKLCADRIK